MLLRQNLKIKENNFNKQYHMLLEVMMNETMISTDESRLFHMSIHYQLWRMVNVHKIASHAHQSNMW